MTTHKLSRLALCAACLLPAACATTSYSRGFVAAVPQGVKGKAGGSPSVEIDGLKVRIESLDYAKKGAEIPPLALRLVFEPRELGYSFDPGQVRLRKADGSILAPNVAESGYRLLAPGSSFTIGFDATLTQEARFELEFGGLARGRRRIDPVRLALARRTGRSYDRLYWLEAIGVILSAPLAAAGGGM
jgi:hypothetical protein